MSPDNIILKSFVEVQNDQFDCFISYFKIIGLLFKKKKNLPIKLKPILQRRLPSVREGGYHVSNAIFFTLDQFDRKMPRERSTHIPDGIFGDETT